MMSLARSLLGAALALAAAPLAIPAQAQSARPAPEAKLLAMTDTIVQAVGAGDTVIIVYAEFDDSANRLNFVTSDASIAIRFAVPGTHVARVPAGVFDSIGKPLHKALFAAVGKRSQRWIEMVIDHGKAEVHWGKLADLPPGTFKDRAEAEMLRVLPGYELEPFHPPEGAATPAPK